MKRRVVDQDSLMNLAERIDWLNFITSTKLAPEVHTSWVDV